MSSDEVIPVMMCQIGWASVAFVRVERLLHLVKNFRWERCSSWHHPGGVLAGTTRAARGADDWNEPSRRAE